MPAALPPRHALATCQVGVERGLVEQVARAHPGLRPAYRRPGLVTWASDAPVPEDLDLGAVFARTWGASLGRADDLAATRAMVAAAAPDRVHVFARGPGAEVEADAEAAEAARAAVAEARAALAGLGAADPTPHPGERVVDVVVAPGEPTMLAVHRHGAGRWGVPGGLPEVVVPPESPSRAYAKIEEAILWAGLQPRSKEVVVEFGSAPGGAALAMVRRGLTVHGVDPSDMDPALLAYVHPGGARVHHYPVRISALRWEDLPARVDWLLMDVHIAPPVALHAIQRFMPRLRPTLRGAVLTLKMSDQGLVSGMPELLDRVRRLGFAEVRATHLPSNRREFCCVAKV